MANLEVGIVGLPNAGKTSVFNALTGAGAEITSYAATRTSANVGVAAVPDARIDALAEAVGSRERVPATVGFSDVAGLVRGAGSQDGLGRGVPRPPAGHRRAGPRGALLRGRERRPSRRPGRSGGRRRDRRPRAAAGRPEHRRAPPRAGRPGCPGRREGREGGAGPARAALAAPRRRPARTHLRRAAPGGHRPADAAAGHLRGQRVRVRRRRARGGPLGLRRRARQRGRAAGGPLRGRAGRDRRPRGARRVPAGAGHAASRACRAWPRPPTGCSAC